MLKNLVNSLFGSRHDREARKFQPQVDEINEEAARLALLPDEEFREQTARLRSIVESRVGELREEIAGLRQQKRNAEDSVERERLGALEERLKETLQDALDEVLPEAFATVKEACRRLVGQEVLVTGQMLRWDMVPYDVQLIGGIALHQGRVAEMATGEGKTLVATMPLYLNALAGRGVHLVTVNSYLAQRDSEWMGHIYRGLGLTVDCLDLHEP